MRSRTRHLLAFSTVAIAACSEGVPAPSAPDAGPSTPDAAMVETPNVGALADPSFVASAEPPRDFSLVVSPPNPGPCPAGWQTIALGDGHRCEPPDTDAACSTGYVDPAGVCRRFGAECPTDGWPADLPAQTPVVYVDADAAAGGDGQRATPFNTLADAMAEVPDTGIVALRTGTYEGRVQIERPITIWGACASATRINGAPSRTLAMLQVRSSGTVRNVALTADSPGIQVLAEDGLGALRLDRVSIERMIGRGISVGPGASLVADDLWVAGVGTDDGRGGQLLDVTDGEVILRRTVLEDGFVAGVDVNPGSRVTLEDSAVRGVRRNAQGFGFGAFVAGGQLTLRRTVIEDVFDIGVVVQESGQLEGELLVIREVASGFNPQIQEPSALAIGAFNAEVTLRGVSIRDAVANAITVTGAESHLTVRDAWVGDVVRRSQRGSITVSGGTGTIERLWIEDDWGVAFIDPTAEGTVRDLTLRTSPAGDDFRCAFSAGGGAYAAAEGLDIIGSAGACAFLEDTRVEVDRMSVRVLGGEARAARAESGGTVVLRGVFCDSIEAQCLFAAGGGHVDASDVFISRTLIGIQASNESRLSLTRVLVDNPAFFALAAETGGVAATDLTVRRPRPEDDRIFAMQLASVRTATLTRVRIDDHRGGGIIITGPSTVRMQDVRILAEYPSSEPDFGLLVFGPEPTLHAERVLLEGFDVGAGIDGRAVLRDVVISRADDSLIGFGLTVDGDVEVHRGRFTQLTGTAINVAERGGLVAEDILIDDINPVNQLSTGVSAIDASRATVNRMEIRRTRTAGILAADQSQVSLQNILIADSKPPSCNDGVCDVGQLVTGLLVQDDATAELEGFALSNLETAGMAVTDNGMLDARSGSIERCGIGILVQNPDYDPNRALDDVRFDSNGRDFFSQVSGVPAVEPLRTPDPPTPGD